MSWGPTGGQQRVMRMFLMFTMYRHSAAGGLWLIRHQHCPKQKQLVHVQGIALGIGNDLADEDLLLLLKK